MVISLAAISFISVGCEGNNTETFPSLVGESWMGIYARSIEELQLIYEADTNASSVAFMLSNLDVLGSVDVLYHYHSLCGRTESHYYGIDKDAYGMGYIDASAWIYDDDLRLLYTIQIYLYLELNLDLPVDGNEDVILSFVNFADTLQYDAVESDADSDDNTISYQLTGAPISYTLEFIGADGTDIQDYSTQIEEQVDILSRNYVVMAAGTVRYVIIPESSSGEEVEA